VFVFRITHDLAFLIAEKPAQACHSEHSEESGSALRIAQQKIRARFAQKDSVARNGSDQKDTSEV
jgi:hypothetical protein